ncbi:hypothetical protein D3C87_257970 [compost metagenome]
MPSGCPTRKCIWPQISSRHTKTVNCLLKEFLNRNYAKEILGPSQSSQDFLPLFLKLIDLRRMRKEQHSDTHKSSKRKPLPPHRKAKTRRPDFAVTSEKSIGQVKRTPDGTIEENTEEAAP